MKNIYLITLFTLLLFGTLSAQDSLLIVEPGPVGTLNEAIMSDTTATGERTDLERIYVLRRGVPYVLSGTIEYSDFHLRIVAEEGDGPRPLIISDTGDDALSQVFRTRGNASLTLDGIHLSCEDILGQFINRAIRINSDSSTIHINNSLIENASQAGIRVQGDHSRIYLTNSVFRNMGRPSNPDNGRLIDNRGQPIDTLWIENSLVHNVTSRYYRNGAGSSIDWARINQNTFGGSGQHAFTFDEVATLQFTNNVVYNSVFLGRPLSEQDTLETARFVIMIDTFDASKNITISHNNFHLDTALISATPTVNVNGDTILSMENFVFSLPAMAAIDSAGTGETNISEALDFVNAAPTPLQFLMAVHQDTTGDSGVPEALPWDFSNLEANADYSAIGTATVTRYSDAHDYNYGGDAASATAGTEGQALGIGALDSATVSNRNVFVRKNILYYPNPMTETLFIQNLDNEPLHRIAISDLTGRKLVDQRAIDNQIHELNVHSLSPGIYILSVIDRSGKMDSRKIMKR